MRQTIFLLSPANCDGRRAKILMNAGANFPLAVQLRTAGLPLGEAFSFMSGLYFRGKLAYARTFAQARLGAGIRVIAPGRGLLDASLVIHRQGLIAMASVSVSLKERTYREPLERDAHLLAASLGEDDRVVLLGSIATDKYVEVLGQTLGDRLLFPAEFVGRGDMSRGGLMLRCVEEGRELEYIPVAGAIRHGPRPAKLAPLPRRVVLRGA
jgi:hypothetical protein